LFIVFRSLDEYDFAFKNLAIDLRDGVRLTKVMEVILLRDDLVKKVRVPGRLTYAFLKHLYCFQNLQCRRTFVQFFLKYLTFERFFEIKTVVLI
jgi:hypothetical protein